jgi:hypothetical protein
MIDGQKLPLMHMKLAYQRLTSIGENSSTVQPTKITFHILDDLICFPLSSYKETFSSFSIVTMISINLDDQIMVTS